jgi:hypothetical protein
MIPLHNFYNPNNNICQIKANILIMLTILILKDNNY